MSQQPISAFPLAWPVGWPRTQFTKDASFSKAGSHAVGHYASKQRLSIADGVERVLQELRRLKVDRQDMIVSTNVKPRLDGFPRSGDAEPYDCGVAVYWQDAQGNRRVMAIDRYHRVADNLAAIAATLEAMRAIERHGGAQILDRAFTGFAALPAPGASRHWRDVLEVGTSENNLGIVSRAYRTLAARCHPDRVGGSHDAMAAVNRAWEQAQEDLR